MSSGGYSHGSKSEDEGSISSVYCSESSHPQGPARPKRAQVKNACVNCQRACKKCDSARPCQRCVRYSLVDTCVDSTRKPRKKGIKRGPYKKRKRAPSDTSSTAIPGRASIASARAKALTERQLVPPYVFGDSKVASDAPREGLPGSGPPLQIANSPAVSGVVDRGPGVHRPAGFRLPPIGSFDYSPPRRPHAASNFIPPMRAHSEQLPPPPLRISRSGIFNTDHATRHPASPLGMLSDVATNYTRNGNNGDIHRHGHMQPPVPAMSHSMHSLSAKPRFDPYVSTPKHIPISSSRFDYTYRVPPRIPSNSVSPWESPAPASGMASPALPRTNGLDSDAGTPVRVKQEQTREMDSSCANSTADVQVRRLSSLLDRTYINPPSPDHTHNGEPSSQFSHWTSDTSDQNQTSNTDVVMPQFDIRREQLQEQNGADHAWRPGEEADSRRLPVAASIADGYTNVPVTAILRQHKKSLSDYKL